MNPHAPDFVFPSMKTFVILASHISHCFGAFPHHVCFLLTASLRSGGNPPAVQTFVGPWAVKHSKVMPRPTTGRQRHKIGPGSGRQRHKIGPGSGRQRHKIGHWLNANGPGFCFISPCLYYANAAIRLISSAFFSGDNKLIFF